MQQTTLSTIKEFLNQHRVAFVGMSRDPKEFSQILYTEFTRRGYDVVAVNPNMTTFDGKTCYARVQDIQPPVDGALLLTNPRVTEQVVRDCAAAGIKQVWMHRGPGGGSVSSSATEFGRQRGITVIDGGCPLMFDPCADGGHKVMRFMFTMTGKVPRNV